MVRPALLKIQHRFRNLPLTRLNPGLTTGPASPLPAQLWQPLGGRPHYCTSTQMAFADGGKAYMEPAPHRKFDGFAARHQIPAVAATPGAQRGPARRCGLL